MRATLGDALAAGAFGLSTSVMDTDRNNRLVPSRHADDAEFDALIGELGRHPGAVFQFVPRFMEAGHFFEDLDRFATIAARRDVPVLYAGYRLEEVLADSRAETAAHVAALRSSGARLTALVSTRPSHVNMHFERSIMWSGVSAWHELVTAPVDAKQTMLEDPAWRARARADWESCTFTLVPIRFPERLRLVGGADGGRTLGDVAARDRVHPSDALVAWLLDTGLAGNLRTVDRPIDDAAAAAALTGEHVLSGASDAGAHIQMFSGAGDSTYVLTHLARDTGLLTIEEAVHAVTAAPAQFFGIPGRGVIAPGAFADLAVFELDMLRNGAEQQAFDLPTGSWRYTREPGGYRATLVAGVPTWADGAPTRERSGTMLARDGSDGDSS
jgi:N-acyl-D-amino-acid deacylase